MDTCDFLAQKVKKVLVKKIGKFLKEKDKPFN